MLGSVGYGRMRGWSLPLRRGRGLLGRDAAAARIIDVVSAARGVTRAEVLSRRRCSHQVAQARQLAMYLVHTLLGRTYFDVGRLFGRDRTTVSHACARIEDLREDHSLFERQVEAIEAAILLGEEASHAAR